MNEISLDSRKEIVEKFTYQISPYEHALFKATCINTNDTYLGKTQENALKKLKDYIEVLKGSFIINRSK